MEKVRFGLLGSGIIARYHARAIKNIPDAEIDIAANWRPESLARLVKEWDIPRSTTEIEALATDPHIDAVINCLPNFMHKQETIRLLRAGKHVFLEKPMAMNAAEAQEILDVVRETGKLLMLGHMWRYDNETNWLRQAIVDGLLGEIVKTKGYHVNPPGFGPQGWFLDKARAGGGVIMDMAVHSIDTCRFLMGDPQPVRVYAAAGVRYKPAEVEDDGTVMVHWDNGAYSVVVTSAFNPYQEEPEGAVEVYGTKGHGRTFPSVLNLSTAGVSGRFAPIFPARIEQCDHPMYQHQIEHFVKCIKEGKQPKPNAEDGLVLMKIIDAAYASARTGEAVKIK
jgi:predicted dehydrogenase